MTICSQAKWQREVRRKLFTSPHFEVQDAQLLQDLEFAVVGERELVSYFYRDNETITQVEYKEDRDNTEEVPGSEHTAFHENQAGIALPTTGQQLTFNLPCHSSETELTSKNSFSSLDTKKLGMD